MASIINDPNGRRRILFVAPDGSRKAIRLGKIDRKSSESIGRHVETLLSAKGSGEAVKPATAAWLTTVGDKLKAKLAAVGLIDGQAAALKLLSWCEEYIAGRKDLAPRTAARLEFSSRLLVEHFGADRRLDSVTVGDAEGYSRWLSLSRAGNTVRREIGRAKQFFGAAVKHERLLRNPFAGMVSRTRPNRTRDHFVTRVEAAKILDACPDAEWRLIITLCRYAGLRCPTEVLALKWGDILWDQCRMNIPNVKTGKQTGESFRTIPIFPEVREQLDEVFLLSPEKSEHVIRRYRDVNANLRTQLGRIARRAEVTLWEKPFVNMRASCATELAQTYPAYIVTAWLGHSQAIAEAHYWQVTEDHFQRAAQNPAQHEAAGKRLEGKSSDGENSESEFVQYVATRDDILHKMPVPLRGFEPLS